MEQHRVQTFIRESNYNAMQPPQHWPNDCQVTVSPSFGTLLQQRYPRLTSDAQERLKVLLPDGREWTLLICQLLHAERAIMFDIITLPSVAQLGRNGAVERLTERLCNLLLSSDNMTICLLSNTWERQLFKQIGACIRHMMPDVWRCVYRANEDTIQLMLSSDETNSTDYGRHQLRACTRLAYGFALFGESVDVILVIDEG